MSLEECAPFAVAAAFDGEVTAAIPQSVAVCVGVAHPHHRPSPGGGKRGVPVGGSVPRVDAAQPGQPESSDRPITDQWQSIITDLFFNVVQNGSNQPVEAERAGRAGELPLVLSRGALRAPALLYTQRVTHTHTHTEREREREREKGRGEGCVCV